MKSYFQASRELNMSARGQVYSCPTTWYIALSSTTIQPDGSGVLEPLATSGYSRVPVQVSPTSWSNCVENVIYNLVDIIFNEATSDWGVMTDFAVFDAETGGNLLYYEKLNRPKSIEMNDEVRFKAGTLKIKEF